MIVLKRHPLKFYGALALAAGFSLFLGVLMLWIAFKPNPEEGEGFMVLMGGAGAIFTFLGLYSIRQYFKYAPIIKVEEHRIFIGSNRYRLSEIEEIELTGKMPFRLIVSVPMEGAALVFRDQQVRFIFNSFYSNTWELKDYLEQTVIKKQEYRKTLIEKVKTSEIRGLAYTDFKALFLTSFRGLGFLFYVVLFSYILLQNLFEPNLPLVGAILVLGLLGLKFHSWLTHFFRLSDKFLIVRNHLFWYQKHIYRLSDIREVTFETQGRMPNCMRIITNDHRDRLFPAGTLRDKNWKALQKSLEEKGIKVRDELF